VITDSSPFADPTKSDRIKVTVGRDVTLDLNETQCAPGDRQGVEGESPSQ
jgi:hypothetical protein